MFCDMGHLTFHAVLCPTQTQLRYEACRAGYSRDCHPPPLVFWDAVTPILLFFSFFITFGAAVRLAR